MATAGSKRIFQLLSEEEEVDNGYVTLVKGKENNGQFIECEDGAFTSTYNFFICSSRSAVTNIFRNSATKQVNILQNYTQGFS